MFNMQGEEEKQGMEITQTLLKEQQTKRKEKIKVFSMMDCHLVPLLILLLQNLDVFKV